MRKILLVVFTILFLVQVQAQELKKKKLIVTYTRSYCGGARPNQEIINALNEPKILANCKVKIESESNKKKYWICKTNDKGEAELKLKKGKYNFYLASNKKNKAELPFDKTCKKLKKKNLSIFEITEEETKIEIRIPCNPCDESLKERR